MKLPTYQSHYRKVMDKTSGNSPKQPVSRASKDKITEDILKTLKLLSQRRKLSLSRYLSEQHLLFFAHQTKIISFFRMAILNPRKIDCIISKFYYHMISIFIF